MTITRTTLNFPKYSTQSELESFGETLSDDFLRMCTTEAAESTVSPATQTTPGVRGIKSPYTARLIPGRLHPGKLHQG
ncbi:unnamed protein product [Caretta caretta]